MQTQRRATHLPNRQRQSLQHARHCILALVLALVIISGIALYHPPLAHAAGPPTLTWDSTMIYPGQNNGNPWGPPGENALVHGAGFQVDAGKQTGPGSNPGK